MNYLIIVEDIVVLETNQEHKALLELVALTQEGYHPKYVIQQGA